MRSTVFICSLAVCLLCCTSNQKVAAQLSEELKFPRIRFSIGGGLSQTLEKTRGSDNETVAQYFKELKSGYGYGADFSYFFLESLGVGLKCNGVIRSNSINDVDITGEYNYSNYSDGDYRLTVDASTNSYFIDLSDHIDQFYVGPTLNVRKFGTDKHTFHVSVSAGYSGFRNNVFFSSRTVSNGSIIVSSSQRLVLYGSTLGSTIGVGYDFNLTRRLALCMNLSLTNGVLRKISEDDGVQIKHLTLNREASISLNHIDFSVGLSFAR